MAVAHKASPKLRTIFAKVASGSGQKKTASAKQLDKGWAPDHGDADDAALVNAVTRAAAAATLAK